MKTLLLVLLLTPAALFGQNFHFSARAGIASYQGDLKAKSISLSQSKFMFGIGARYDLTEHIALRSYLMFTGVKADDKKGTTAMKARNLNFQTGIIDWEGGIHYSILDLNSHWWTPYVYAGVGLFHFKPRTKDENGNKVNLQPLATEGQGLVPGVKKYGLTQFNIPIGIGVERMLNEDMRVGFEIGYRKLFTDYLDDVSDVYADEAILSSSKGPAAAAIAYRGDEVGAGPYPTVGTTRGNPDNKDGYFYIGFTYTLRFYFDKYKQIAGLPSSKGSKKVGCPATRY